jgi:hypothetical protein
VITIADELTTEIGRTQILKELKTLKSRAIYNQYNSDGSVDSRKFQKLMYEIRQANYDVIWDSSDNPVEIRKNKFLTISLPDEPTKVEPLPMDKMERPGIVAATARFVHRFTKNSWKLFDVTVKLRRWGWF